MIDVPLAQRRARRAVRRDDGFASFYLRERSHLARALGATLDGAALGSEAADVQRADTLDWLALGEPSAPVPAPLALAVPGKVLMARTAPVVSADGAACASTLPTGAVPVQETVTPDGLTVVARLEPGAIVACDGRANRRCVRSVRGGPLRAAGSAGPCRRPRDERRVPTRADAGRLPLGPAAGGHGVGGACSPARRVAYPVDPALGLVRLSSDEQVDPAQASFTVHLVFVNASGGVLAEAQTEGRVAR